MTNKYIFKDLHYGQLFSLKEDGPDILYRQKTSFNSSRKLVYEILKDTTRYNFLDSKIDEKKEVILNQPLIYNYVSYLIRKCVIESSFIPKINSEFQEKLFNTDYHLNDVLNSETEKETKKLFVEYITSKINIEGLKDVFE